MQSISSITHFIISFTNLHSPIIIIIMIIHKAKQKGVWKMCSHFFFPIISLSSSECRMRLWSAFFKKQKCHRVCYIQYLDTLLLLINFFIYQQQWTSYNVFLFVSSEIVHWLFFDGWPLKLYLVDHAFFKKKKKKKRYQGFSC